MLLAWQPCWKPCTCGPSTGECFGVCCVSLSDCLVFTDSRPMYTPMYTALNMATILSLTFTDRSSTDGQRTVSRYVGEYIFVWLHDRGSFGTRIWCRTVRSQPYGGRCGGGGGVTCGYPCRCTAGPHTTHERPPPPPTAEQLNRRT